MGDDAAADLVACQPNDADRDLGELDGSMVLFALSLSLVSALLSGVVPAVQASKTDVLSALKDETQSSLEHRRLRSAFVVAQVAFSLLLVVSAAVLGRGLDKVTSVNRGFDRVPSRSLRSIRHGRVHCGDRPGIHAGARIGFETWRASSARRSLTALRVPSAEAWAG